MAAHESAADAGAPADTQPRRVALRGAGVWRHIPAAVIFALLACAWSYPVIVHLSTVVPGAGAGDNLTFLWNVWWMRQALGSATDTFFVSSYMFVPTGVDLTLHTHTASLAWFAATALGRLDVVTAFNLLIIGCLFLNAFAAYGLVFELTGQRAASILGGVVFGGSPYVMAHLHGHLNLVAAWVLPLFAACLHRTLRDGSCGWAIATGAALLCAAYTDYYYVIYSLVFAVLYTSGTWFAWSVSWKPHLFRHYGTERVVLGLLVAHLVLAASIGLTGGWSLHGGGIHLSMKRPTNTLTIAWVLLALSIVLRGTPRLSIKAEAGSARQRALLLAPALIVFVVGTLPLLHHAVRLWRQGDYVSPSYTWRSSPAGIDLLALFAGNPFHPLWPRTSLTVRESLGLDPIEGVAWLGVVPLLWLGLSAVRRSPKDRESLRWWTIGAVFLLWALGPYLTLGSVNTGLFLPSFLARYVPVLANARMPGRAIVLVYLAVAVLLSRTAAGTATDRRRRVGLCGVLSAAMVVDFFAAPFPVYPVDVPAIYRLVRDAPGPSRSALCELPLGIRDGFGEIGQLDHAVLYYQTFHQHPLVGGFIARLSPRVKQYYESHPALGPLLALSARHPTTTFEAVTDLPHRIEGGLNRLGVRYVMLNRATASSELVHVVHQMAGLTRVAEDGSRELFLLETAPAAPLAMNSLAR